MQHVQGVRQVLQGPFQLNIPAETWPGADDPWKRFGGSPQHTMCMFYEAFSGLGRISAGFAARLVHVGMLTALTCLASKAAGLEQSVEAAEHAAGDTSAPLEEAHWDQDCYAVFARAVPQVSRLAPSTGR